MKLPIIVRINNVSSELIDFIQNKEVIIVVDDDFMDEKSIIDSEEALFWASKMIMKALDITLELRKKGINARCLNPYEAGILTNKNQRDAIIENIDLFYYSRYFKKHQVVVIPGGIGRYGMDFTFLGRSGGFQSAIALGIRFNTKVYLDLLNYQAMDNYHSLYHDMLDRGVSSKAIGMLDGFNKIYYAR